MAETADTGSSDLEWSYDRGYRKVPDGIIRVLARHPIALAVYMQILLRARWTDGEVMTSHGRRRLKAGQAMFGRGELAAAIGSNETPVRSALKRLQDARILTIEATKLGSIATLLGYRENAELDATREPSNQPTNQPTDRPRSDQQTADRPTTNVDGIDGINGTDGVDRESRAGARAVDVQAISRQTWAEVSAARVQVAAELGIPDVMPLPDRYGWPSEPRGCRELRDRVREEGDHAAAVCERVVKNLLAQAREEKSIEWLSEKAFTPGGWTWARNWLPGQAGRSARSGRRGAIGSAAPRSDHGTEARDCNEVFG